MGFRINTNVAAMDAHRNSLKTNAGLDKSLNALSSGVRINKAADDASGMVIADSLRSQAQGLGQAINNANDGVAVVQTADGALDEYVNIINTVRTKSIQAASDGQNSDSRKAIQADIDRLLEAANSIANTTQFNGQKLLDGTFTNKSFHIGAYAGETVNLSVGNVQTNSVGDIKSMNGAETRTAFTPANLNEGATGQALVADSLKINDTDVSSAINTLSPTRLSDAAGVAAAITDATGLVAEGHNTLNGAAAVTAGAITDGEFKINGVAIAATTVLAGDSNGALVKAINDISDQTGVTATLSTDKKLVLESNDGSNISITTKDNIDQDTLTYSNASVTADVFTVTSAGGSVTYTAATGDTADSIRDGIMALINASATFSATAALNSDGAIVLTGKAAGDLTYTVGGTGGGATTADLTNLDSKAFTGLTADNLTNGVGAATATINSAATAAVSLEAGQLVINGIDLVGTYGNGSTAGSAGEALLAAIKDIDGMEDSTIELDGQLKLVVNNGDDLNIAGTLASSTFGLTKGVTNESKIGSVEIYSDTAVKVGGTAPGSFGFTAGTKAVTEQGASLESIDVTNRNSAEVGILITDSALKQLDKTRADLGSVQNQLESTIRNISVTQVNVTSAESQIRDVDFASESANFAKFNILAQSGSYAMSQANAVQQNVMRLLQ